MDYSPESVNQLLGDLNEFIHQGTKLFEYHMEHIELVRRYSLLINKRLSASIDTNKIETISLAHDLFKERSLDKKKTFITWRDYQIPQNINRYVRMNLDVLEEYGLAEYFNSDIQLHPQAAAIFLIQELGITDTDILYPVIFHACPIIPVYETLHADTRRMIDVVMLADKLSSNTLKINSRNLKSRVDLDKVVFSDNGHEFNYTLGLFIARLLSQGNSKEENSIISTNHYYKRLCEINPMVSGKNYSIRTLGRYKTWQKRSHRHLQMR